MSTRFANQFKRAAVPNLLDAFGETVTYYASGSSTGREITALVNRDNAPQFVIRVKNDSSSGISSSELDTGGDEISFPLRVGEGVVRRSIVELMDDSAGMTRVICE